MKTQNKLFPEEQTDLSMNCLQRFEPSRGKTNNLHMRKQRRRSASR